MIPEPTLQSVLMRRMDVLLVGNHCGTDPTIGDHVSHKR